MKKAVSALLIFSASVVLANSNIDISFVNFIEKVSQQNNVNIYIDEDIKDKKVSLFIPEHITNKNLMKLLRSTISKMNFNLNRVGSNYFLTKKLSIPKQNYIYKLKYNSINDCKNILNIMKVEYSYLSDSNTILMTSTKSKHNEVISFLNQVDTKQKQVILKIMIYEFQDTDINEIGVKFATLYNNIEGVSEIALNTIVAPLSTSKNTLSSLSFYGAFRALDEAKIIKVKQFPYILAKNNKKFTFEAVENIPYLVNTTVTEAANTSEQTSVEYKDVGLKINGLTTIYSNYITLDVDIVIEDLLKDTTANNMPQIYKRHLNSNTDIEYNNVLLISGLKRDKNEVNNINIPLLSEIPILGEIFKYEYEDNQNLNITIAIEVINNIKKNSDEIISDLNL